MLVNIQYKVELNYVSIDAKKIIKNYFGLSKITKSVSTFLGVSIVVLRNIYKISTYRQKIKNLGHNSSFGYQEYSS